MNNVDELYSDRTSNQDDKGESKGQGDLLQEPQRYRTTRIEAEYSPYISIAAFRHIRRACSWPPSTQPILALPSTIPCLRCTTNYSLHLSSIPCMIFHLTDYWHAHWMQATNGKCTALRQDVGLRLREGDGGKATTTGNRAFSRWRRPPPGPAGYAVPCPRDQHRRTGTPARHRQSTLHPSR